MLGISACCLMVMVHICINSAGWLISLFLNVLQFMLILTKNLSIMSRSNIESQYDTVLAVILFLFFQLCNGTVVVGMCIVSIFLDVHIDLKSLVYLLSVIQ